MEFFYQFESSYLLVLLDILSGGELCVILLGEFVRCICLRLWCNSYVLGRKGGISRSWWSDDSKNEGIIGYLGLNAGLPGHGRTF